MRCNVRSGNGERGYGREGDPRASCDAVEVDFVRVPDGEEGTTIGRDRRFEDSVSIALSYSDD